MVGRINNDPVLKGDNSHSANSDSVMISNPPDKTWELNNPPATKDMGVDVTTKEVNNPDISSLDAPFLAISKIND